MKKKFILNKYKIIIIKTKFKERTEVNYLFALKKRR